MAIEKNIKINVDTKEAVSDVNKLDKSFKDLDNQTEKTSTGLKDVGENGGAIALLDSVTGGLATRFRDAYEATKLFNFSLKGTRAALIATGVGAFVVALGLIVAYWSEINDFMEGATKRLEKQHDAYQRILGDLDQELKLNKLSQDIAVKKGESTANLLKLEKDLLLKKKETIQLDLDNLRIQLEKEQSLTREFTLLEKGLTALKAYVFGYDSIGQSVVEAYGFDVISDIQGKINELEVLAKETELALTPDSTKEGDKLPEAQEVGDGLNFEDTNTLNSKKLLNELLNDEDIKLQESQSLRDARRLKDAEIIANYEIYQAEQVKNAKIAIAGQTLNIIGMLAKEGSDLAKGIAASQATINTFLGVTSALSAPSTIPEPFGTILKFANAAAIGISGAINVQKILATKPVTTSAASGAAGGRAPAPPSFNLVQGTASNQINDSLQTQEPVRAIVVSRDVTSAQEANRNSENNSTL